MMLLHFDLVQGKVLSRRQMGQCKHPFLFRYRSAYILLIYCDQMPMLLRVN